LADGKVIIETGLDTKGVESGLKKFQGLVKTGFKVSTASVAAAGVAAIKMGADFEAGMSEVQAISGASGKDLAALTAKAKEMGAATKFSATESAEALKYMAMAGWKTKQMTAGLPGIMNLAAASGEDLATVSDIVTDSMTAFGLQAKEAGHFADVLAKASSSSNTNVGMMGATFKYVAPIAGSMKYSIEDTATAIGLMANAGIKGEQAGTTLRAVLTRLVKPPKDAAAALDELGVSAKNSDGTMKPLREVIGDLREKFAGLNDSQKAQYAASIAGQEAMSGLLAIVNASPSDFDKLTKAIDKSDGSAEKMAKTMQNNLKGQITILKSSLEGLGIEIYDNVKKPLTNAAKAGIKAVNSLTAKVKKGGIKAIIPAETITALKNFGTTALNIAKTALPILGKGIATVGNNIKTVLPAVAALVVGFKTLKVVTTVAAAFTTASAAMEGAKTGTLLLGTAINLFTGKTIAATGATTAFNAAMTALGGPVGLAVVAIGALAAGTIAYAIATKGSKKESDDAAQSIQNLTQKRKELSKEYQQNEKERKSNISSAKDEANTTQFLFARLKDLNKIQGKTTAQKQEMARIVDELNEKLPDLNLHYDKEKDKLDKTTESIRKQIDAQKDLLLAKAEQKNMESLAEDIVSQEKQVASAKKAVGKATKEQTKAQDELNEAEQKWKDAGGSKLITEYNDYIVARDHLKEKKKLQGEANDELEKEKKKLDELNSKYDKTAKSYNTKMNLPDITKDITEMAKKAKIKGNEIKKSLLEGVASGKYAKPKNGDDLKQLINLDRLMKDAKNAGLKIPEYLKSGISNGSISFKDAVAQLESGLNFQNLYEKAFGKGAEIPRGLAEGIRSGQYAVPTTVNGMKALVQFNDLQNKGLKAGVQIPSKIAEGIISGNTKPNAAIKQMNSFVSFADLVDKSWKAGDKAVKELVKSVNAGKTSPKKAMEELTKLMGDAGVKGGEKAGSKTGKKIDDSTASGVTENKGTINTATQGAVNDAQDVDTSGFNTLGGNIAAGIAAGIGGSAGLIAGAAAGAVMQGLEAGKKKSKTHSPSVLFRDELGRYLALGIAVGIDKNAGKVAEASMRVINVTIGAAKKQSPQKKFKKIIGESIPKGIRDGIKSAQKGAISAVKSLMENLLKASKTTTKFSDTGSNFVDSFKNSLDGQKDKSVTSIKNLTDTQIKAAKKQIDKSEKKRLEAAEKAYKNAQKKHGKNSKQAKKAKNSLNNVKDDIKAQKAAAGKAGKAVATAYNKAITAETNRLEKLADQKINEISDKYQQKYDEIIQKQESLTDKQQGYGSVYDLDQNLHDIEDYQRRLKALENKIPQSMMDRILGMDVEEGRQYMAWFQSLTAVEQKAYTDKWNRQQSMSESFSKNFFSDDIANLKAGYAKEIDAVVKDLKAQMNTAGKNVWQGFINGMNGQKKNLDKSTKKLCDGIIKAVKGKFKIHSPSKVFDEISRYNLKGAEKGTKKEAPKLYREIDTVADTMVARFARANLNLPDLQNRLQAAVAQQMSKITASIQPQIVYAGGGGTTTIEKTVYTGPEKIEVVTNIEGREAARTLAPFMDSRLNSMADRKARGGV
jgi:TP901 family phage tail tape measure protein